MHYYSDNPEFLEFGHTPNVGARLQTVGTALQLLRVNPDVLSGESQATKQSQQSEVQRITPVTDINEYKQAKAETTGGVDIARNAVNDAFINVTQEYPDVLKKAA